MVPILNPSTLWEMYKIRTKVMPTIKVDDSANVSLQQQHHNTLASDIKGTLKKILANQEQMATEIKNQQIAQK